MVSESVTTYCHFGPKYKHSFEFLTNMIDKLHFQSLYLDFVSFKD